MSFRCLWLTLKKGSGKEAPLSLRKRPTAIHGGEGAFPCSHISLQEVSYSKCPCPSKGRNQWLPHMGPHGNLTPPLASQLWFLPPDLSLQPRRDTDLEPPKFHILLRRQEGDKDALSPGVYCRGNRKWFQPFFLSACAFCLSLSDTNILQQTVRNKSTCVENVQKSHQDIFSLEGKASLWKPCFQVPNRLCLHPFLSMFCPRQQELRSCDAP